MSDTKLGPLTLERLAAGAMNESETIRLTTLLSTEEGGLERLDALMQSNEEFFEKYPANIVVPQINDQYARQKRRQKRGEKKMITQATALKVALGISILGVAGVAVSQFKPASDEKALAEAPLVSAYAKTIKEKPATPVVQAGNHSKQSTPQELLSLDELLLVEGTSRDFDATGVTRINVEESAMVGTRAKDETITLEGLKTGITGMQIHSEDEVKVLYVRVASAYPDVLTKQMKAELEPAMKTCGDTYGAATLLGRVVVDRQGIILKVQWDAETRASDEIQKCAQEAIMAREFKTLEKAEVTIATMSWEF